jgi:hypothetical protein
MTILDKVTSETRNILNMFFDNEPLNYLEAASLYSIISQGRYNISILQVMYNHAQDITLKELIREVIDRHTRLTVEQSEDILKDKGQPLPRIHFNDRQLQKTPLDIPADAKFEDKEIAIAIGTMAKAAQSVILAALHQSYQLEVALMYRKILEAGLDWDYRLLQLMLSRGWLPHIAKMEH